MVCPLYASLEAAVEPTRRLASYEHTPSASSTSLTLAPSAVPARGRPERIAHAISLIFLPPLVAIATFAVVSVHLADSGLDAVLFAVIASVFVAILPVGYIAWLLRHERVHGGIDLEFRQERQAPYLLAAASSGVGEAALWAVGAPASMLVLATLYGVSAVVMAVINRRWKISAHAAGAGLGLGAMVSSFGAIALPLAILLPAVCWARVRIDMHSRAQVIAGATLGTLTGLAPLAMHGLH